MQAAARAVVGELWRGWQHSESLCRRSTAELPGSITTTSEFPDAAWGWHGLQAEPGLDVKLVRFASVLLPYNSCWLVKWIPKNEIISSRSKAELLRLLHLPVRFLFLGSEPD